MNRLFAILVLLFFAGCVASNQRASTGSRLWRVLVGDRYGFIDKAGNLVIPPEYVNAGSFSEGLAFVELPSGKRGYIRPNGSLAFSFSNENGDSCQYFHEGLAPFRREGKHGFVSRAGEVVISPRFTAAYRFSQGRAPVEVDGSWGVIDRDGKWIVEPSFRLLRPYSDSLAVAVTHDKKWGYIDRVGNVAIPFRFKSATDFHNGLALVADSAGFQFINKTGEVVYKVPSHLRIRPFFASSLAAVQDEKTKRWGFLNTSFELEIPCTFDECSDFSEGLAAVLVGDKWGYINTEGKLVISPRFAECQNFENGLARVNLREHDGMWRGSGAIIDRTGQTIWPKEEVRTSR